MKVAVIGSRSAVINNLEVYIPENCTEIVSGGAVGIDQCAAEYADKAGIALKIFLPMYELYGRAAPIVRNRQIVEYADHVIAFWDGVSQGTLSVIRYCEQTNTSCRVIYLDEQEKI